jgi:hypothetical protein
MSALARHIETIAGHFTDDEAAILRAAALVLEQKAQATPLVPCGHCGTRVPQAELVPAPHAGVGQCNACQNRLEKAGHHLKPWGRAPGQSYEG